MGEALPPSRKFRWPILVVLDGSGEESSMLDLKVGVAQRLHLMEGAESSSDPPTDGPGFNSFFVQALADLHTAGLIEADEQGRLWITEEGRRVSEIDVEELPESDGERPGHVADEPPAAPQKSTLRDYFFALLESWH